jgi:hypothetical protein
MTISSSTVSTNSISNYISSNASVAQIQKQISTLQQDVQVEDQSKDSSETKQQTVQSLQLQIQMLQIQMEQTQAKPADKSSPEENGHDMDFAAGVSAASGHMLDVTA